MAVGLDYSQQMQLQLPSALEELVRHKIASGLYRDETDVVSEALRLLDRMAVEGPWPPIDGHVDDGDKLERLRAEIAKGEASAARGEVTVLETDADIDRFFDALDAR